MLRANSPIRLRARWLPALLMLIGARAASAEPDARQAAAEHFARGVQSANSGAYEAALREFNEAYLLSPHYAVLYNIGQSQVGLGHPLEAIAALSQYLSEGKDNIPGPRRAQIDAQMQLLQARLAELAIQSDSAGARVSVDGRLVGVTPLSEPVHVVAGTHTVSLAREGNAPTSRSVTVGEGEKRDVHVDLTAGDASHPVSIAGNLAVRCDDLAIQAVVDGTIVARESLSAGVSVAPGLHHVGLLVSGRPTLDHNIDVPTGGRVVVFCAETPLENPAIQRPGEPTTRSAPFFGYLAGGAGLALGGASLVHYLWNRDRYQGWQGTQSELDRQATPSADRWQTQAMNNDLADSIARGSRVTVGLAAAGGALLTTSAILLLAGANTGSSATARAHNTARTGATVHLSVSSDGFNLAGRW